MLKILLLLGLINHGFIKMINGQGLLIEVVKVHHSNERNKEEKR